MRGRRAGPQPLLFHTAARVPLYCPYPLAVAVPAMLFAHLLLAGPIEGVVTALAVRYLQASDAALLNIRALATAPSPAPPAISRRFWWALGVLIVLSPLGLLASGTAWGEWGADELQKMLGFVPAGMQRLADTWSHAPFADYSLPGFESFWAAALIYVLCAVLGVGTICLLTFAFWRLQMAERRRQNETPQVLR